MTVSKRDREPKTAKEKAGQGPSVEVGDGKEQNKTETNEEPSVRQDTHPGRTSKARLADPAPQSGKNTGGLKKIIIAAVLIVLIAGVGFWLWTRGRTFPDPMELTDTWEEIAAAGRDGTYKEKYRIGNTKELDMGSEGTITMKLVAMDEDELADGSGKAPMTWVSDELLNSKHNMNSQLTNKGGWETSGMRAWLGETVLPLMPEEVRNNIREVIKYSYSYDEQKDVVSKDTIWIPSAREVFLADIEREKNYEKEGVLYASVFTDSGSRVRRRDGESGASWWWLRSASYYHSTNFGYVFSDGDTIYNGYANGEGGVVVGFCF